MSTDEAGRAFGEDEELRAGLGFGAGEDLTLGG